MARCRLATRSRNSSFFSAKISHTGKMEWNSKQAVCEEENTTRKLLCSTIHSCSGLLVCLDTNKNWNFIPTHLAATCKNLHSDVSFLFFADIKMYKMNLAVAKRR